MPLLTAGRLTLAWLVFLASAAQARQISSKSPLPVVSALSVASPGRAGLFAPLETQAARPAPPLLPALTVSRPAAPLQAPQQLWIRVVSPATLLGLPEALASDAPAQSGLILGSLFDGQIHGPPDGQPVPSSARSQPLSGHGLLAVAHRASRRGHAPLSYGAARRQLFATVDRVVVDGQEGIIDGYSGTFVPGRSDNGADYPERGDRNRDGRVDRRGMNVEHIWPQSFFNEDLPMRSDLHHLMATFMHPNERRGTLPFGEVRGRPDYQNAAGAKVGGGVFEPPNAVKGRVARAMLYFYTRYYDRHILDAGLVDAFWNSKIELFLRWSRLYPPTALEQRRNDLIEGIQGNRNPFVDDPGLADRIGAAALRINDRYPRSKAPAFRQ